MTAEPSLWPPQILLPVNRPQLTDCQEILFFESIARAGLQQMTYDLIFQQFRQFSILEDSYMSV